MGYDKQEQTPPGDENNQPTETSGNDGSTQTNTDTRSESGHQVNWDTSNNIF